MNFENWLESLPPHAQARMREMARFCGAMMVLGGNLGVIFAHNPDSQRKFANLARIGEEQVKANLEPSAKV